MRLRNREEEPRGGWKYRYEDGHGNPYLVRGDSLKDLTRKVTTDMKLNSVAVPENLQAYIEDQIASAQPSNKVLYDGGIGDRVTRPIHAFAGGVDTAFAVLGIQTNLKKRAKECLGCAKRRMALNK